MKLTEKNVATLIFVFILLISIPRFAPAVALVSQERSQFVQNTLYESFEEPIDWTNAQYGPVTGVFPGMFRDYTFSQSGVALTYPIPNTLVAGQPKVNIFPANEYSLGMGSYGKIYPERVPDGTHYLVAVGTDNPGAFQLTFPYDTVTRVGGFWMMSGVTPGQDRIEVDAYGLSGNWLGSALIPACNASDWKNNFYGFAAPDGSYIKTITIVAWINTPNASLPAADNLMFDYALPTDKTWLCNSGCTGSWNQPTNWDYGKPENPGESAIFGTSITSPLSVTMDGSQKAGKLIFDNASAPYTLTTASSSDKLVLDNNGSDAEINVNSGSHVITTPITLDSNLLVTSNTDTSLDVLGSIQGLGKSLTKSGDGLLILGGINTYTGGTIVNGGTLQISSPNGLSSGCSLTIGNNAVVLLGSGMTVPARGYASSASSSVPEPGTIYMLFVALTTLLFFSHRKFRKHSRS